MASKRSFRSDQCGAVYLEFTVLVMLFFTLLFGVVEFTYVMWQWNAAAMAVQAGVRIAVVSDPGPSALTATSVPGTDPGSRLSAASYAYTCKGDGTGGCSAAAMTRIVTRMQRFLPSLRPSEVEVRYTANGLAVTGGSGGMVPTVEVRIVGKTIPTVMLSFIGINEVKLPTVGEAMIGEDLKTSYP